MGALENSPARGDALAPLTVRTADRRLGGEAALVFENLTPRGYRIGMPDSEFECDALFDAIVAAVERIHAAGVVHLDLYPSNIMWSKVGAVFSVVIIDWDSAHFIGEILPDLVRGRLQQRALYLMGAEPPTEAIETLDTSLISLLSTWRHEVTLKTLSKERLDAAFNVLVMREEPDHLDRPVKRARGSSV